MCFYLFKSKICLKKNAIIPQSSFVKKKRNVLCQNGVRYSGSLKNHCLLKIENFHKTILQILLCDQLIK